MPGCRAARFGCPAAVDEFLAVVRYDVRASDSSTEPALLLIGNAGPAPPPGPA
jgi:hypothetical protein